MENLPKEYAEPFELCVDLLNRSSVDIYNRKLTFLEKVKRVGLLILVSIYQLSLLIRASKVFSEDIPFVELAFIMSMVIVVTQCILKTAVTVPKLAKIRFIIFELGSVWKTDHLTDIQNQMKTDALKTFNTVLKVVYWMNILGSWHYMLVPLYETLLRKYILKQESDFLLPFACSFPFDSNNGWTNYMVAYLFEIVAMIHLVYLYLGTEFLMVTLCSHLSTQFILLQEDFRQIDPTANQNSTFDGLRDKNGYVGIKSVIRKHQKLIELTKQLDEVFNVMIFINLLFASLSICLFGFAATVPQAGHGLIDVVDNLVSVIALVLPILNLCYYAHLLAEASTGIADAAYESLWYQGDISYQKVILTIIRRSQTPCYLKSLKYSPITLKTFTAVMSTTWSYFSLATSMYKDTS